MIKDKVERPKASKKKINSKNEFELCYLRHKYFRKTDYNPTEEEMDPYNWIIEHGSYNTYTVYKNLFLLIGFYAEDIISISKIHLVSYLGLFAIEKNKDKFDTFVEIYRKNVGRNPTKEEILNKNKALFTLFLNQRMEDLVRIVRQKAKNIKGFPTEEYGFFYGEKRPPRVLRDLLSNYEAHGYKRMEASLFRTLCKKSKIKQDKSVYRIGNLWYVRLPLEKKNATLEDFSGAGLDPYDNICYMTPDRLYSDREQSDYWDKKKQEFRDTPKVKRIELVTSFIEKNKGNPRLKEEVNIALRTLKRWG